MVGHAHETEVLIDDRPRFAWRGLMLDSARHFQSPEFIKRMTGKTKAKAASGN